MGGLKAGGLALILRNSNPENVGRVVRLEFMVESGGVYGAPNGRMALNATEGGVWVVTGNVYCVAHNNGFKGIGYCQCSPKNLMPIDEYDPDAEQTKNKEKENEK